MTKNVTVMWSPSADPSVAGYCLYYGTASGNYTTRLDVGTNTTATVSNLQGGLTYYFVATAYNGAKVESNPSSEAKVVLSTNASPAMVAIPSQNVNVADVLSVTNRATESGVSRFTYSLAAGAPNGMKINPVSGVVTWSPQFNSAGSTIPVTVRATDPSGGSATTTFNVVVGNAAQLTFGTTIVTAGSTGSVSLTLTSSIALTNLSFTLDAPVGRVANVTVQPLSPTIASVTQQPAGANHSVVTVKGVNGQALPMGQPLLQFNFTATAGQHSAFTAWTGTSISAIQTDGGALPRAFAGGGRVVMLGPEPLVDALPQSGGQRTLVLYGHVGSHYALQGTSDPRGQGTWSTLLSGTFTNLSQTLPPISGTNGSGFYRAYTF